MSCPKIRSDPFVSVGVVLIVQNYFCILSAFSNGNHNLLLRSKSWPLLILGFPPNSYEYKCFLKRQLLTILRKVTISWTCMLKLNKLLWFTWKKGYVFGIESCKAVNICCFILTLAKTKINFHLFQLKEHITRLREELDREREERNYFQLERDRIHTFWDCTERELQEARAELKNMEKAIEEDEWRHQVEIKVRILKV